ncbi:GNAT family N-acetyltransferase [Flavitalea sp.]|nr:GNAT family N-acetyltransferase [Flavitalea sp.]
MLTIKRTSSADPDFIELVKLLDADLAIRDGADHAFYSQFNKIDKIKHVIVAYDIDVPIACGAIKEYSPTAMEVKRMFTSPEYRGKGAAIFILTELETWAREMSYTSCVLETGNKQPEAIALYHKTGYHIIPNYGQYAGIENSICFEKKFQ